MSPEESRDLKKGDRVCWQDDPRDQGDVVRRDWSGVEIKWDNSATPIFYFHNDMGTVTKVNIVKW